jgi:hypothetical protein
MAESSKDEKKRNEALKMHAAYKEALKILGKYTLFHFAVFVCFHSIIFTGEISNDTTV